MKIPFKYTIKNFTARKLTTFITIFGVALVVFVFAAVLMMAYGIQKTLIATGLPDNVLITRKAANGEISSLVDGETQDVIRTLSNIAVNEEGKQIISKEPVVIINLNKISGGLSNVTVRGVSEVIFELRPQVKIIEGKMFSVGLRELIVGSAVTERFKGARIGDEVRFAGDNWKIVGVFDSDGSGFDSEMWGDSRALLNAFNRGNTVSSVTIKLDNINNFKDFKKNFEFDRRLQQYEAKIEQQYFEEQSELMANFIRVLGIFITVIFSFGATIGATITMYAAVANRTVEVGVLRALGYKRRSILIVFLIESLVIAISGGIIGIFLASFLQFFNISTLNFGSFAELSFSFSISPSIIISSLIFAVLMGIIGGFLPSIRAARLNIVNALRAA
ncbi:MAG: ABC transporter permease [Ignavibacteria bacterium]|nr:ABC transporter permease [Ignavibacteria bacterium]MBT8381429.1 ABC transporter permease [Ignavibacteria bacterium]MBT8392288.1 ABC transporter permease [Ignavibacteria bacterium]NNJ52721.1 FtsX-like permease family protein [Ignavibacteriaceae bacterium]NNL20377.1 FtsX-like permease family protein [Ignavibacteriaceae bacterium]